MFFIDCRYAIFFQICYLKIYCPQEEEEEENEDPDEPQQEEGPPLLNMINQDRDVDGLPAWSAARSSDLIPAYSIAVLKSNTWPGACAYGFDKKFENVYIGFGHKYSSENYSPPPPPPVFEEYTTDLEVNNKYYFISHMNVIFILFVSSLLVSSWFNQY